MADLVGGKYPQNSALQSFLGATFNTEQGNVPIRTNLEWPVYSGALVDTASMGGATTGIMVAVPIPVDVGMVVSKISFLCGATAAGTPTHSFAALYSGTTVASPPLIGQSTDGATAAIAASARYDFTLTSATGITSAQAPWGWVWAAIGLTASTVASAITTPAGAAAGQYRWFTNSPLYFSQTSGSAVGGTAPATLINAATLTVAPIVFLS